MGRTENFDEMRSRRTFESSEQVSEQVRWCRAWHSRTHYDPQALFWEYCGMELLLGGGARICFLVEVLVPADWGWNAGCMTNLLRQMEVCRIWHWFVLSQALASSLQLSKATSHYHDRHYQLCMFRSRMYLHKFSWLQFFHESADLRI